MVRKYTFIPEINEELNGPNIIAKKLKIDDYMEIGYILPNSIHPSHLTSEYIEILRDLTASSKRRRKT